MYLFRTHIHDNRGVMENKQIAYSINVTERTGLTLLTKVNLEIYLIIHFRYMKELIPMLL